jgi:RHS repeat-associated protein
MFRSRSRVSRGLVPLTVLAVTASLVQLLAVVTSPHAARASADAATGSSGEFVPVAGRILDTRSTSALTANTWRTVQVDGVAGVPASGVSAVAVTVTVLSPTVRGLAFVGPNTSTYTSILPASAAVPAVLYDQGVGGTISNSSVVAVASNGQIVVGALTSVNVLIDVQGYYTANGSGTAPGGYVPVTATRVISTKTGTGVPLAKLAPGSTTVMSIAGHAGVPADASAVFVNITLISYSTTDHPYVVPFATGTAMPNTSVNFAANATTAQGSAVDLSASGQMSLYLTSGTTASDVMIDVEGYYAASAPSGAFTPAATRIYDSRSLGVSGGALAANSTTQVQVAGIAGVPAIGTGIEAVAVNVTAIETSTTAQGYVNVWADDQSQPGTSVLNFAGAAQRSNLTIVAVGADGGINIANTGNAATDIVLDVQGWYQGGQVIANGQTRTQHSVTLQAAQAANANGVTYQWQQGISGGWANVPLADVVIQGGTSHPASWPVSTSASGGFDAYVWNMLPALNYPNSDVLVQVRACFTVSGSSTTVCSPPQDVQFTTGFGDSDATATFGPGTLSLQNGDLQVSATDVDVASYLGNLTVGRTLTTLHPSTDAANGVFGSGWTASLPGPDAGSGDATLQVSATGYVGVTYSDGSVDYYQKVTSAYPIQYVPVLDAAASGSTLVRTDATTISLTDADGTVTSYKLNGAAWQMRTIQQPGSATTTTYSYDSYGRVTRILAASQTTCTGSGVNPDTIVGCRSLILDYGTAPGYSSGTRLVDIELSVPVTPGVAHPLVVAQYAYDVFGRLYQAWDPRGGGLKTTYTYDGNGRLATVTPPGQAAWTLDYGSLYQLVTVSRSDPSTTPATIATQSAVYGVPVTGSGSPVDLGTSAAAGWGQSDLPYMATAVFPASHVPAGTTIYTVSPTDWPYATITYIDPNGEPVNTASYGAANWQYGADTYDSNGNLTRSLTAENRRQAVSPSGATDSYVAAQGSSATRADLLATVNSYNPLQPSEQVESQGPTHPITLASGTVLDGRDDTQTAYDQGAPTPAAGDPAWQLPTTTLSQPYNVNAAVGLPVGSVSAASPTDTRTTRTGYTQTQSCSGTATTAWMLHAATTSTVQMNSIPTSADLTTTTLYNCADQLTSKSLPADTAGTGAQTTVTAYYNIGSGACASAEFAGLVCSTSPAAQPATGKPLAITTYTYDADFNTLSTIETYGTGGGATVRTSSVTYDAADRPTSHSVAVTPTANGGTAIPTVSYGYDPASGLPTSKTTNGTGGQTLTTSYDNVARPITYTDAAGTTTTTYNLDGQVASVNDGKGTITYTYDSSTEHRGMVTSEDVGVAPSPSEFQATYNADGAMTDETYPNGLLAATTVDNAGNPTRLNYSLGGTSWMTFTANTGADGRTAGQSSPISNQVFTYDGDGRLTGVNDNVTGGGYTTGCMARTYRYDKDSNRTSLSSYPGPVNSCSTSSGTTVNSSFDAADRITSAGYSYDALGRTLTVPSTDGIGIGAHAGTTGALTVGYDSNDMVASQAQGASTLIFGLDPEQDRIAASSDGSTTTTNHFSSDSDSPTWTSVSAGGWTRNLTGPDGNLVATADQTGTVTLQLATLHGDIVATAADDPAATGTATYSETSEYGAPRDPTAANTTYGWLGAGQRSSNDLAGLTLMGVRLYNSATGRFTSPDPVLGGNANAYIYPDDPINHTDINGKYEISHTFTVSLSSEKFEVGDSAAEIAESADGVAERYMDDVPFFGHEVHHVLAGIINAIKAAKQFYDLFKLLGAKGVKLRITVGVKAKHWWSRPTPFFKVVPEWRF